MPNFKIEANGLFHEHLLDEEVSRVLAAIADPDWGTADVLDEIERTNFMDKYDVHGHHNKFVQEALRLLFTSKRPCIESCFECGKHTLANNIFILQSPCEEHHSFMLMIDDTEPADMRYLCIWGAGYIDEGETVIQAEHEYGWFTNAMGYDEDDLLRIKNLNLGEGHNCYDGGYHCVVRIR